MFNVDYFITKFEAIPEDKWCVRTRDNGQGQRCAHGHCAGDSPHSYGLYTDEELGLIRLAAEARSLGLAYFVRTCRTGFANINNDACEYYPQETPKQRVLAVLRDIKKLQTSVYEDITKELAILPKDEVLDSKVNVCQ